jgi:hypothetical protein
MARKHKNYIREWRKKAGLTQKRSSTDCASSPAAIRSTPSFASLKPKRLSVV